MSAALADPDLAELLGDVAPRCGCNCHQGDVPAAKVWLDQHGCDDFYLCISCLARMRAWFLLYRVALCEFCKSAYPSFPTYITRLVDI